MRIHVLRRRTLHVLVALLLLTTTAAVATAAATLGAGPADAAADAVAAAARTTRPTSTVTVTVRPTATVTVTATKTVTATSATTSTVTTTTTATRTVTATTTVSSCPVSSTPPALDEGFLTWPSGATTDGTMDIANWTGTGGPLSAANVGIAGGYASLTNRAGDTSGAEISTLRPGPTYGQYGYYEWRVQPSPVPGAVQSGFTIAQGYVGYEYDAFELIRRPGMAHLLVTTNVHGDGIASNSNYQEYDPGVDLSGAFHRFGLLVTANSVTWYLDGVAFRTLSSNLPQTSIHSGYVMANVWSGVPEWDGGPNTQDVTAVYDYVRGWPGATAPQ